MKKGEMQQGTMRYVLCPCHLREKSKVNGWSKIKSQNSSKRNGTPKNHNKEPPQLSWQRTKVRGDDADGRWTITGNTDPST
jgi:hypothetical protein